MHSSAVVDIQNTYGAAFVGLLVNVMLFGFLLAQACIYYSQYWYKDKKPLKLFVAFLLFTETMSSIMCTLAIYRHLILNFGNVESSVVSLRVMNAVPLFGAMSCCLVQFYYVRRAYITSESLFCPIIVVPLVLFSISFGLTFTIKTLVAGTDNVHTPPWLPSLSMAVTVLGDVVITATICWSLHRKRTGMARTDSMITTLIVNTVNAGFVLSAVDTAILVLYSVAPNNLIWLAVFWVESKCFVNSFLAMLNFRDYVRNRSTPNKSTCKWSSFRIVPQGNFQYRNPAVAVKVHSPAAVEFPQL